MAGLHLFADDTNLFVSGKTVHETVVKANACIEALQLWFLANRLSLNLVKTSYSVFGDTNVSDDFKLKIGATVLKRVTSYKYLGIIIDDNFTWKEHIDYVYNNTVKICQLFYRIKHRLPYKTLKMIYFAFVHFQL